MGFFSPQACPQEAAEWIHGEGTVGRRRPRPGLAAQTGGSGFLLHLRCLGHSPRRKDSGKEQSIQQLKSFYLLIRIMPRASPADLKMML